MITVVVFEFSVMRCQPLRRALVANEEIAAKTECLGLIVRVLCSILHFELRDLGSRN
ncbi:acetyltransferase [Vibrio parahaemolyticus]|nr:acetyltransferase [Vibrio parahaemolyticus]EGR5853385.1 acetyltransferase [Vibrio parahaemolyticus]